MITQDASQAPSPAASNISNEFEKDTSRGFFGSFKTPEKQFTAIAAIPDPVPGVLIPPSQDAVEQLDHRLKSPSPSSSTCSEEIMDVERLVGLVGESGGGNGGLINVQGDSLLDYDEPSSVLASKLLLALDNPSPPPSSATRTSNGVDRMGTQDSRGSYRESESISPFPDRPPRGLLAQPRVSPTLPSASNEPDLITFDSFDEILDPVLPPLDRMDPPQSPPPSPPTFLDDLVLNSSTMHTTPEVLQGFTDTSTDLQHVGSTSNVSTSMAPGQKSLDVGSDQTPCITPSGLEQITPITSTPNTAETMLHPASPPLSGRPPGIPSPNDLQQTPLRRSLRPRKSTQAHAFDYLASPGPSKDQPSPLPSTGTQTCKSRKGKERETPPSIEKGPESETRHERKNGLFKPDGKQSKLEFQRRYSGSPVRREPSRELGSLSPNSAGLLIQLIPSITPPVESTPNTHHTTQGLIPTPGVSLPSGMGSEHMPHSTSQLPPLPDRAPVILDSSSRYSSPSKTPSTPRKSHTSRSPSKLPPQPALLDDPSCTPARRIPIRQAIAEGRISPQKMLRMQTGTPAPVSPFTGQTIPVLNMSLKGDASPARRVFTVPSSGHEMVPYPKSPSKDQPTGFETQQANRPTEVSSQKAMTMSRPKKLPYPLIAAPKTKTDFEQNDTKSNEVLLADTPTKSSLKQTKSRIPRKKPYSKTGVVSSSATTKPSSLRTVERTQTIGGTNPSKKNITSVQTVAAPQDETTPATAKKRVIRAVDLSKSTTNKFCHLSLPSSPPEVSTLATGTDTGNNPVPTHGHLKRKRLDSKIGPVASSRSTALRQVPVVAPATTTTTFSRPTASSSSRTNQKMFSSKTQSQTANKPTVMKFRRVMPPEPAAHAPPISSEPGQSDDTSPSPPAPNQPQVQEDTLPTERVVTLSPPVKENTIESSSPTRASPPSMTSFPSSPPTITSLLHSSPPPPPPLIFIIDPLSPRLDSTPECVHDIALAPNVRRTSRLRKPTQIQPNSSTVNSDLNSTSYETRTHQRRRSKVGQNSRSNTDDVFLGMSDKALKSLTANNTVRNQHYTVANLEMEIVRKEGTRPESPAVKIKTIIQREQEEKLRQREERAVRRAKRHGEGDFEADENIDEAGHEGAILPIDLHGLHLGNAPSRHRRGAGEEEDYETPLKNIEGQVNGERRVKWDRGLFTEVFLDEFVPGTKAPPKENITVKGCLTTTAKTLQLDTLGNLADLNNALPNLTQENVVVKKFVYDDDDDVAQPPAPVAVDRNTRSKSKKANS